MVECGGGGQHVVGIGRHEGGREGGGVVREEVSRRGLAGAVDGAVDGVASGDVGGKALEEAGGRRRERAGGLGGEKRDAVPLAEGTRVVALPRDDAPLARGAVVEAGGRGGGRPRVARSGCVGVPSRLAHERAPTLGKSELLCRN